MPNWRFLPNNSFIVSIPLLMRLLILLGHLFASFNGAISCAGPILDANVRWQRHKVIVHTADELEWD
ncbi:hypothetical protein niasHS_000190 [Heterodera schachtii]|uniref:Uncharacterized protein n=1 Tax=Heterodera schachtii TaxID=97005 RepID=A0ABD2KC36_HETSC